MGKVDIAKTFAASFKQGASNTGAYIFSETIRFIAIMMVILAVIWCTNHFMGSEEREQDSFLIHLGSRLIRLVLGFCLFILILIVKGH